MYRWRWRLSGVEMAPEGPRAGYSREQFKHWNRGLDPADGCDSCRRSSSPRRSTLRRWGRGARCRAAGSGPRMTRCGSPRRLRWMSTTWFRWLRPGIPGPRRARRLMWHVRCPNGGGLVDEAPWRPARSGPPARRCRSRTRSPRRHARCELPTSWACSDIDRPVQMQITIFPRVRPRSACTWASAIRSRG